MAAAMATKKEKRAINPVNLANGTARIPPRSVTTQEWVSIIEKAIEGFVVPERSVDFKSIGQFFGEHPEKHYYEIPDSSAIRLDEAKLNPGFRFLYLYGDGSLLSQWPHGTDKLDVPRRFLFLSDQGVLLMLALVWEAHEVPSFQTSHRFSDVPDKKLVFRAKNVRITLTSVCKYLESVDMTVWPHPGIVILRSLRTVIDRRGEALETALREAKHDLHDADRRLGLFAT